MRLLVYKEKIGRITNMKKAKKIIAENIAKLHKLAQYLYINETITGDEFMEILNKE